MIQNTINNLVAYSQIHLGVKALDKVFLKNILCDLLSVTDMFETEVDEKAISQMKVPDVMLDEVKNHIIENNLMEEEYIPNYLGKIMGYLTPMPSQVAEKFNELYACDKVKATDYLYDLSIKNNYIQKTAVDKNLWWQADYEKGQSLEITINLSKPEKSNKDIAKLLTEKSTNYPKCMLCYDNVGFKGNLSKPARQNLRTVDLTLDKGDWFMQYSPYVYYDEHCIVINKNHSQMTIDHSTFRKLTDFVDMFPHYFVGSNACLPIVGGSILNHEHYQGGLHLMPLHYSSEKYNFKDENNKDVAISILDWYNSCVRIESKDKVSAINVATKILDTFYNYSDETVGVFAETDGVPHNTVTPVVRKRNGNYVIEIILRNNITSEQHPDGVFHAHKEYHDVKSEGIGLIEAMGLFILPPRLKKSMEENPSVYTKEYVNNACQNILKNTAIFKDDEKGIQAFKRFLTACGFMEV